MHHASCDHHLPPQSGMLPVHPRLYLEASRARAKSAAAREAAAAESAEKEEHGESSVDNEDTSSQDKNESTPT